MMRPTDVAVVISNTGRVGANPPARRAAKVIAVTGSVPSRRSCNVVLIVETLEQREHLHADDLGAGRNGHALAAVALRSGAARAERSA